MINRMIKDLEESSWTSLRRSDRFFRRPLECRRERRQSRLYSRAISLVESLVTFVGMDESRYTTAETIQVVNRLNSTPWNSATICKPVTWMAHKWSNIFNPNKNQLNTIITIFPLISLIFSTLLHDSPNVQFYRNYKKKEKRKFCNIQIPITAHATL